MLCEFLATHGYVVIGSAFQKVDAPPECTGNRQGSRRHSVPVILRRRVCRYVDWGRIGMVGHSLGAQAAIIYQTEPGCAIDATVSLDTTQDYHSLAEPDWKSMTEAVREGRPI